MAQLSSVLITQCVHDAPIDPQWKDATINEMTALHKNKTSELVKLPKEKRTVGCKWVYNVKRKLEESLERHKARLVANGCSHTTGLTIKRHLLKWIRNS